MPRPKNTERRRAQIADALIAVMARHGYDGASVNEIARAAELTPGLVHYHFKSKQEILLAALRALLARHEARLEDRLAHVGDDAAQQVATFIDLHLGRGASADPEALACWVLLGGEALRQPPVRAPYGAGVARLVERLRAIIARGVAQRVFTCDDAAAAASAIVAAIQGYYGLAATARELIPKGSAARSTLRMAEGLLRPRSPLAPRPSG